METSLCDKKWVGFKNYEWEVHKFGGTSVANAECFEKVADIIESQLGIIRESSSLYSNNVNGAIRNEVPERSQDATTAYTTSYADKRTAIVLSAMGGKPKVTDLLLLAVKAAASREYEKVNSILDAIMKKHFDCIDKLPLDKYTPPGGKMDSACFVKERIKSDISDLKDILKTVSLMKWQANKISELVSGYGELWSTQILAMLLSYRSTQLESDSETQHRFIYIDARRVITIEEEGIQDGVICWDVSKEYLTKVYDEECQILSSCPETINEMESDVHIHLVVTGYVASNSEGVATTLQRDGSDYSAAIMGRLLLSNSINIWTDVDGVLSADPRRVPTAFPIPEVSYNEAMELAYFGAKVIHPKTMRPAIMSLPHIPIYIKNTFHPFSPGTRIYTSSSTKTDPDKCVCGFSTVENMALINVEGTGMIGVKGVANRLFGALESSGINIVLISQASSEHSITFATSSASAYRAKEAIEETFAKEIRQQHISEVCVTTSCAIIAAVGDGMSAVAGVAGRFFSALGHSKINVLAIAQGSSERNISAVVKMEESTRALRAVHAAFRLSNVTVRVGIVGMNDIGEALLDLLYHQYAKLCSTFDINLQVCAVLKDSKSSQIVCLQNNNNEFDSITPEIYNDTLKRKEPMPDAITVVLEGGIEALSKYVTSEECAHTVIFDCTADEQVGKYHPIWLSSNIHVITANNTALSGPRSLRSAISKAEKIYGKLSAQYLPGVTVGGALPVVNTLQNLLNSGDKIKRICGIFSTSLSYIMHRIAPPPGFIDSSTFDDMNSGVTKITDTIKNITQDYDAGCSFSQAVSEAVALGLMEENPLKDLSNEYTARCLMVIAKELGMDKNHDTEKIQLMSDMLIINVEEENGKGAVANCAIDSERYEELDARMQERVEVAKVKGCVPRHVSTIDVETGEIKINIVDVPNTHIYALNPPSCECVRFYTENHKQFPLVIQVSYCCN